MTSSNGTNESGTAIIGSAKNFWRYNSGIGYDLTHPETPESDKISPSVTIETTASPITVDPEKTALVVIDMQNFFLSPALGASQGPGHRAADQLAQNAVPAARKAGIRILWVNWGLTQEEIDIMPPAILKAFGFKGDGRSGKYKGMGSEMGMVKDPETEKEVDAGRLLMRDQWNSALLHPLNNMYNEGSQLKSKPDLWIHKNRMSGSWNKTPLLDFLEENNIRTCLFTGVNTDQCVGGTYQDCFSKGFDCILLSDGCGTTSPDCAQEAIEFNAANTWGFSTTCKAFADGVDKMTQ